MMNVSGPPCGDDAHIGHLVFQAESPSRENVTRFRDFNLEYAGKYRKLTRQGDPLDSDPNDRLSIEGKVDAAPYWVFRVSPGDRDTSGRGAKRSELAQDSSPSSGLEAGKRYVALMSIAYDFSPALKSEFSVWQVLPNHNASPYGRPWIQFVVGKGFEKIVVRNAVSREVMPEDIDRTVKIPYKDDARKGEWATWVVSFSAGHPKGEPLVVYRNGRKVADQVVPMGYRTQDEGKPLDYWKQGVYHWTNNGNSFSGDAGDITVRMKGAYIYEVPPKPDYGQISAYAKCLFGKKKK